MTSPAWILTALEASDLGAANAIDRQFPSPWTLSQLEGEFYGPAGWRLAGRESVSGKLTGFLIARNMAGDAEILKLAVDTPYQRQGLGSLLLNHLLEILSEEQISNCHLELRSTNHQARSVYEKSDFVMTGLRNKYYTDPVDDAINMTRIVAKQ